MAGDSKGYATLASEKGSLMADYLQQANQLVKGGKWGKVGDLQNTGLVRTPQGYMTAEEAKANNLLQGDPRY